jgi:hypothetical protein
VRAAVHDALATDYLCATDEMGVFGTHPYKRSSGRAGGFPDNHDEQQKHTLAVLLLDEPGCGGPPLRFHSSSAGRASHRSGGRHSRDR